MKLFLTFCFLAGFNVLIAQCPYKIAIDVLDWEGKTVTLKWHCQLKPSSGQFDIFRTCLSINREEKWVSSVSVIKNFQFSDTDTDLKNNLIYQYRLQLSSNEKCWASERTKGRVIDSSDLTKLIIRNLSSFTQKDILNLKPQKLSATANTYLLVETEIKDFKFPFSTNMKYALICGDKVIETAFHTNGDDSRWVSVYILENMALSKEFEIALFQGNDILGISPLIELKE